MIANREKFSSIPFELYGKLIAVEASLNGKKSTFILDTGASETVLNSSHLNSEMQINKSKTISSSISGKQPELKFYQIEHFEFQGNEAKNEDFLAVDLNHVEVSLGKSIHGLLGNDILSAFHVYLDYRKKELKLIEPEDLDEFKAQYLSDRYFINCGFTIEQSVPILEVKTLGQTLKCALDTGSELNLIDSKKCDPLDNQIKKLRKGNLILVENKPIQVYAGQVPSMEIGDKSFKGIKTIFKDIQNKGTYKDIVIDGVIGFPILIRQPVIISYPNKELIFVL